MIMERLTNKREADAQRKAYETRMKQGYPRNIPEERFLRLAAYEDTGLEPEEIARILDAYGRGMTLRTENAQRLGIVKDIQTDRLRELAEADREGRCVVLDMPRKPLVWGDDDQDTCLCPDCGKDLMGIPYGERMVLQCPECGQYLDATKAITRAEAEEALRGEQNV